MTISELSFDGSMGCQVTVETRSGLSPLGAHESVAGGLWKAVSRMAGLGGTALQIFTRNQRQWSAPPLSDEEVEAFVRARSGWGSHPVVSHASYLINLASPDETAWRRGAEALGEEIARCRRLGVDFLVLHPGAALGAPLDQALDRVARGLDAAWLAAGEEQGRAPLLLLENVAGQGTSLGRNFAELAAILSRADCGPEAGVCLDTCHAFAAGYDLSTPQGFEDTLAELDDRIGLGRLGVLHLNDSKHALGSGKDRHEHIGLGALGLAAFARIMTDPGLRGKPKILETHKSEDLREDAANLAVLRTLEAGGDARELVWREKPEKGGKDKRI